MEYTLKDLLDVPRLRNLLDSLADINTIPTAILDNEGNILTANGWQDICTKFHRINPETEKKCLESDLGIEAGLTNNKPYVSYRCPMGLIDAAVPIVVEGKHLGNTFVGQLFLETPDETRFVEQARQYGFDETEYLVAMRKVPIYSEEQFRPKLVFIGQLAQMLAEQGLQLKRQLEAEATLQSNTRRHHSILKTAMDGFWVTDLGGHFLEVNLSYCNMSGYSERELLTMCISDIEATESPEETADRIKYIIAYGSNRFESRHRRKDGTEYDVEVSTQFHSEGDGQFVVFVRDITERKQTENAINQSEYFFKESQRAAFIGSYHADFIVGRWKSSEILDVIFGIDSDYDRSIQGWLDIVHPEDKDFMGRYLLEEVISNRKPFSKEYRIIRQNDGAIRWVNGLGAADFNNHGNIVSLRGTIQDITERKLMEASLRESEERFRSYVALSPHAIFVADNNGRYIDVNPAASTITGFSADELLSMSIPDLLPLESLEWGKNSFKELQEAGHYTGEAAFKKKNGEIGYWSLEAIALSSNRFMGIVTDITERKRSERQRLKLENQLQESRKMESIGRLAGGVAHDFNNMLSVILGHSELGLMRIEPNHPVYSDLKEISSTAERSADLTKQLLAFARKQTIAPRVIDLNEAVARMLKMLQRLIGEEINLAWKPAAGILSVKMDTSQLDQILVNLCVNARDAISGIGAIIIETGSCSIGENYCLTHVDSLPGDYAKLSVSDDGVGMDEEMLAHIFEPFFTSKEFGKGTGLGLSTVYGAIRQNNGFVEVYSEPHKGTTFTVYLPRHENRTETSQQTGLPETAAKGNETILLVEDELAILNVAMMLLTKLGYKVLAANTPSEALRLAREHTDSIHLLMTDVVMPEMNGRDLAKKMLSINPGMKRLFMSGYTADMIAQHGILEEGVHFIQKPFNWNTLAEKLREALDS